MGETEFVRAQVKELAGRLREPRRHIQSIGGARQVGKTTLALQAARRSGLPCHFASADEPTLRAGGEWIRAQWEEARLLARGSKKKGALLILDEVQKIPQWSGTVKSLWDEDTRKKMPLKVVLPGSAPLLLGRGLTESLAGRFETSYLPHWSFTEMQRAFGWSLNQYLFFGAYPGAAPFIKDSARWARYIKDSLIETTISRDVFLLARVDKPALVRRLFEMGCSYSGQIISYRKIAWHLQDRGNITTLAHYLDLLAGCGTLAGLQKYTGGIVASRRSIPKLQVFNTALISVQSGLSLRDALADRQLWRRITKSAVGAHLLNAAAAGECELFYWQENNREVDFVLRKAKKVMVIEVESGAAPSSFSGLEAFADKFQPANILIVGADGISLERFLSTPVAHWFS